MLPKGLLKEHAKELVMLIKLLDVVTTYIAAQCSYFFKFSMFISSFHYLSATLIGSLILPVVFSFFSLYAPVRGQALFNYLIRLIQACCFFALTLAGLAFLTKSGESFSRAWFLLWMVSNSVLLIAFRCGLLFFLRYMRSLGMNERRVLVFGTGHLSEKLIENVQQALWTGFRIVCIIDENNTGSLRNISGIPVLSKSLALETYLTEKDIDEIWLALSLEETTNIKMILHELRHYTLTVRFILNIPNLDLWQYKVTDLAGLPTINVCTSPMVGINRMIKACEDRLFALIILLFISPLFILIAAVIKFTSPGPIFYRQKRIGWNGHEFEMLKFRTMPIDAERKTGPVWASVQDERPTKWGKYLRRFSLDELPQFINVLKGEMSIVGPRPERRVFVDEFSNSIPRYMQKHLVKAGITGWAQVNGWRGNTSLEKRIEYDLFYIENWSLLFDLKIIFLTLIRGFINRNAY